MLRRTPLKRTGPLKRVSKKQAAELKIYYEKREVYLAAHPVCEAAALIFPDEAFWGCTHHSTHIHHVNGRGPYLNGEEFFMAVCSNCHTWIHAHPKVARNRALLK